MVKSMKSPSFRLLSAGVASVAVHAAVSFAPYLGTSREEILASGPRIGNPSVIRLVALDTPNSELVHTLDRVQEQISPAPPTLPAQANTEPNNPRPKIVGEELIPIDGSTFFPPNQLSRPAEPAVPVPLDSSELGQLPRAGRAVLTIWIDSRGNVVETRVESSDVPEQFVRFAEEAFRKAPFLPGERNGRPVGTVMRIEVRYDDLTDPPG